MTDSQRYFSKDYAQARARFLAAAKRRGARLQSHFHPLCGPNRGILACDSALVGTPHAKRLLICVSGTHGLEGFAGSAAQTAWLTTGIAVPEHVATLLIHALNPWGFAHSTRTNENNVDLNRNFIDFHGARLPENPLYAEVHAALCPAQWTPATIDAAQHQLQLAQAEHGAGAVLDMLNRGQYSHADGLIYGGHEPQWSNRVLHQIIDEHAAGIEQALVIDLHTGLGDYSEPVFLPFDAPGSPERAFVDTAFGLTGQLVTAFDGNARPDYQGLACAAIARILCDACVGKIVVEFGTLPLAKMLLAVQIDRLLRFTRVQEPQSTELRSFVREAFNPSDPSWQSAVTAHAATILQQGLSALARSP